MLELLNKQVAHCACPINDTDTDANVQIRTFTQALGIYSVKRHFMNTQD